MSWVQKAVHVPPCAWCGTPHARAECPSCGAPAAVAPVDNSFDVLKVAIAMQQDEMKYRLELDLQKAQIKT